LKAVILAGGAGTRLRPLTYMVPKCMLPIGGKPLLERTFQYFKTIGVKDFVVCVAYLKKQVMSQIGDGSSLGVNIEYAESEIPMGTAGQLKTAEKFVDSTFFAMNGDIVTSLDLQKLLAAHTARRGIGTISLKKFEVKIPYGHIKVNDSGIIQNFEEKPTLSFMANAGVYAFEKRIFDYIPPVKFSSLETDIFPKLIAGGESLGSFYDDGAYWADVGSMVDFERVNDDYLASENLAVQH
jgi:NDP-sugar pyrophosphorylase family protein